MPSLGFEMDISPALVNRQGKRTVPVSRSTNMDDAAIVSMVEHGLGETILSRLVMEGMSAKVSCLSLDPPAHRKLGLIYPRHMSPERSFRRFISSCRTAIDRMDGDT